MPLAFQGGTIVLTGERGSGKSALVNRLIRSGDEQRLSVLFLPKKARYVEKGGRGGINPRRSPAMTPYFPAASPFVRGSLSMQWLATK